MRRLISHICSLGPLGFLREARKMGVALLVLAGLAVGVSCVSGPSAASKDKASLKLATHENVITVFLTGNELGALKPCGCSGGQLGGLDRRAAVFKGVPKQRRLVVDTGWLVKDDSEQDLIKFNTIIQAFGLLSYDAVNLAEKDVEIAENFGLLDSLGPGLSLISAYRVGEEIQDSRPKAQDSGNRDSAVQVKHTKQFLLKDGAVAVTVAAFDARSKPVDQVGEPFSREAGLRTVNILIVNECDDGLIASIADEGLVDCVVCPAESDEPKVVAEAIRRPLVISVGRYGKYVGRLQITAVEGEGELNLSFSAVWVTEDLPQEVALVRLYKDYQRLVKEAGLLERYPRFALRDGLEYVGSESCKTCHAYEYEKWSGKAHADAFATLERVGSKYDPECVVCHVVGMEHQSGFISPEQTGHLKNVGCENCHGPGSEHVKSLGSVETTEPRMDCTDCHTPEHSSEYAADEEGYFEKIVHWREPNCVGNVEK